MTKTHTINIVIPYIWQSNINGVSDLVQHALKHLQQQDIGFIECHISEILEVAQNLVNNGCQIILSTGATAYFLQKKLNIEVHTIQTGAFDVLYAVSTLKKVQKIALLTNETDFNLNDYADIFSREIQHFTYDAYLTAKAKIIEIQEQQFDAVIGSPIAVELALAHGLKGQLLISHDSILSALRNSLQRLSKIQIQQKQFKILTDTFHHLEQGICFISRQGIIQFSNKAMRLLLERSGQDIDFLPFQQIFPSIKFEFKDHTQTSPQQYIVSFLNKQLVLNLITITDHQVNGWILTAQALNVLEKNTQELRKLNHALPSCRYQFQDIITQDQFFKQQLQLAQAYAKTNSTILIIGESGTGKEMIAQSIHQASTRRHEPFVALNCGAFPENLLESELFGYEDGAFTGAKKKGKIGLIELAHQGTLFLDEIGDLPLHLQTRLLRVLQEKQLYRLGATFPQKIDIRVISATHANLENLVSEKKFRADLYYRLNVLRLNVPNLQQRKNDVVLLIEQFCTYYQLAYDLIPQDFLNHLHQHRWQGNIRELENIIERLSILMPVIGTSDTVQLLHYFPEITEKSKSSKRIVEDTLFLRGKITAHELKTIENLLIENHGDLNLTAKQLNISRTTLWRRLKKMKHNS